MHTNTLQGFAIINFISTIISTQLNISKECVSHKFLSDFISSVISRSMKLRERRRKEQTFKSAANQTVLTAISYTDQVTNFQFQITLAVCYSQSSRTPQKKEHFKIWSDKNILKTFLRLNPNRMQMRFSLASQKRNPQSYVIECSWHKHRGSQISLVFLGAFVQSRKAPTSFTYVRPHVSARLPLDGFSWYLILVSFMEV